jgi:hypothetical protein
MATSKLKTRGHRGGEEQEEALGSRGQRRYKYYSSYDYNNYLKGNGSHTCSVHPHCV